MAATLTDHIVGWAASFSHDLQTEGAVEPAKVFLLDAIACLLVGSTEPAACIVQRYVAYVDSHGDCTAIGVPAKVTAPSAAFVNGVSINASDYEVSGIPSISGASNLVPPAFAVAEVRAQAGVPVSGLEFLGAVVAGWELQSRLKAAGPANAPGLHPPGIIGPMGAATTSGKLLNLSDQEFRAAYGAVASRASGLTANIGSMVKPTHVGNAARAGIECALLAKFGLTASTDIFGGPDGYFESLFADTFQSETLVESLNDDLAMVRRGYNIKRYPVEITLQQLLSAVEDAIGDTAVAPADVVSVEIALGEIRRKLDRPNPTSGIDGQYSYQYAAALPLVRRPVTTHCFADEVLFSDEMRAVLPRVTLACDPSIPTSREERRVDARISLRDGTVLAGTCAAFKGEHRNPMTREERLEKFERCADGVLSEAASRDVVALIEDFENAEEGPYELLSLLAEGRRQ